MARKEVIVNIQDDKHELTFRIKQMPATQLESWIIRAALVLAGAGGGNEFEEMKVIKDGQEAGTYLANNLGRILPRLGSLDYEKAKPLLDELLACCWHKIDKYEQHCTPEYIDSIIQDVRTLFKLRVEALKVNLDFLSLGGERN